MTAIVSLNGSGYSGLMRRFCIVFITVLLSAFVLFPPFEAEAVGINDSKHNLSVSGPGPVKSLTEDRICVFCHTPHNSYRLSSANGGAGGGLGPIAPDEYTYLPLWNHQVTVQPETGLYWSSTLKAPMSQPTGPTKLCLSCHDGTVAIGAVASGANLGIAGKMTDFPADPKSNIGTDLSNHHPVSFPYSSSLPNSELASPDGLPGPIKFWGNNELHCSTCHDPHDDSHLDASGNLGSFLVMDNTSSQLCEACHLLTGWNVSAHDKCEDCHTPHFAVQPAGWPQGWLLTFSSDEGCLTCHSEPIVHTTSAPTSRNVQSTRYRASQTAALPAANIRRQIEKISSHRSSANASSFSQRMQMAQRRSGQSEVTCTGCHSPHSVNIRKASAPYASGMLEGVSGIDRNGIEVSPVTYEYEVCFKCHSDYSSDLSKVSRVVSTSNKRLQFDPMNPSYHPVVSLGKNLSIPSIPSSYEPSLTSSSLIYCTDCHRDDSGGSKGPHGSSFAPILRERYETMDGRPESIQSYALCYRCHNRDSILRDDSFKKNSLGKGGHSGHLAAGAPCSACHAPHGVPDDGRSGSHTHLINFDRGIVSPKQGSEFPVFQDTGLFSGNCTLVCHGRAHNNESYPVASSPSLSGLKRALDRGGSGGPGKLK